MNRILQFRNWSASGAVLATIVVVASGFTDAGVMQPISGDPVTIDSGKVAGTLLDTGVHAYFGVPYAAAPVNNLRWRGPQPVTAWSGIYNADSPQPECIQNMPRTTAFNFPGEAEPISEDCLYLNIWTPGDIDNNSQLPVMVYIHGGGFRSGSPNQLEISGGEIARQGIVYVSIGYRLGIFGYMAHPELTAESDHNSSGNWGVLDQLAALEWVQRNIGAFGGDASNVTLVGHSAGSESVYTIQSSPLAEGLFARVSGWSGANLPPGGRPPGPRADAEADGVKLQQALNAKSVAEMRALSWDRINAGLTVLADQGVQLQTRPNVDGYVLPDLPENIFREHKQIDVPLLASTAANDLGTLSRFANVTTLAEFRDAARAQYGDAAEEFLKLFPASTDAEAAKQARFAGANNGFGIANRDWARTHAWTSNQPVFLAQFNRSRAYRSDLQWVGEPSEPRGAFHGGDIGYWLGTYAYGGNLSGPLVRESWDEELSRIMMGALVAFAKTGNPGTPDLEFPLYDPANERRVVFGDSVEIEDMPTEKIEFLRAHAPPR